jgi:hypothetical protein
MNLPYNTIDIHAHVKLMFSLIGPKIIEKCKLDIDLKSSQWIIKFNNGNFIDSRVSDCLEIGKQPYVESYFTNNFD